MLIFRRFLPQILCSFLIACAVHPKPFPSPLPEITPVASRFPITITANPTAQSPSSSATPTSTAQPAIIPTPTELPISSPRLVVLAGNLPGPDDLLLGPDNAIYLSDVVDGTIKRYTQDGRLEGFLTGLAEPEGMVFLPDGSLVIVEQAVNRLVRFDPRTKTLSTFLQFENRTGQLGVDGIALRTEGNQPSWIVIPDSPNGRIFEVSLDGKTLKQIKGGFVRPTGVWVEKDNSLLVVDEDAGTLSRIHPDGSIQHLAELPTPDDVVEDQAGNIYVNTLGDGAIHLIRSGSTKDEILIEGFSSPQGLIFNPDGNLIVTDPGHHQLDEVIIH